MQSGDARSIWLYLDIYRQQAHMLVIKARVSVHSRISLHTKNHNWPHPIEADQSCIQGHISSWACRVHCVMNCLGRLAQSRKSAQGTETPFHITHHPMLLLAALISTGQSCRELIGMSNFRDDNSTIAGFFFSFLFSSHLFSEKSLASLVSLCTVCACCHHCCNVCHI